MTFHTTHITALNPSTIYYYSCMLLVCGCNFHTFMLHLVNTAYTAEETAYTIKVFELKQLAHYEVNFEGRSQVQVLLAMISVRSLCS